ncbi:hypothetical protein HPB49_002633 [Dermacentor silvarum]|uniref:Uncharacterized protein n=1 Tax=Dermacentor silvarum TaxID=543639 RepID=A0ACB8CD65_DERSI|nr:hypothetical protein HPB49_002633 [Dermacentor silvarum]
MRSASTRQRYLPPPPQSCRTFSQLSYEWQSYRRILVPTFQSICAIANHLTILKTHHIELVSRLLSVERMVLAGRIYGIAPYLAAPTNSCRGVIHGVAPGATPEELRDLDCYQADILARRMGNTNSALITFAGMHVHF